MGGVTSPTAAEGRRKRRWCGYVYWRRSWVQAAGETAKKTWLSQSAALGEGGCCALSRPSDDLKIS